MKLGFLFGVIEVLAVSAMLSTLFFNRFIRSILPAEQKIVPINSWDIGKMETITSDATVSTRYKCNWLPNLWKKRTKKPKSTIDLIITFRSE